MSRLIDADKAVRAVHGEFDECLVWDESGETTADEFENIILQIPTVDAVPIVRCKDCKHYWKNKPSDDVPVCLASPRDDAFCSEGERIKYEID